MAVVPVGHLDDTTSQDWPGIQNRARQIVLQRLAQIGVKDLERHIKFEMSYTPLDWRERYNLVKGSTLGLGHNLTQMGYLRPHNRHARYRNLYFVGASTRPGSGVAAVLVSARLTTERVLRDAGIPVPLASKLTGPSWRERLYLKGEQPACYRGVIQDMGAGSE